MVKVHPVLLADHTFGQLSALSAELLDRVTQSLARLKQCFSPHDLNEVGCARQC
jgi:hypothetical protein